MSVLKKLLFFLRDIKYIDVLKALIRNDMILKICNNWLVWHQTIRMAPTYKTQSECLGVCWLKSWLDSKRQREPWGACRGAFSQEYWEKSLREIFPELGWMGGAPELSLLKHQLDLGKDCWKKRTWTIEVGGIMAGVWIELCFQYSVWSYRTKLVSLAQNIFCFFLPLFTNILHPHL